MLDRTEDTALDAVIRRAREDVRAYGGELDRDPAGAPVALRDAPQVLVPARVIGWDLPRILDQACGPGESADIMYRLGCRIGGAHAAAFFAVDRDDGADPLYRVLTGPFHFAWAGYGDVDLLILEPHLDDRFAVLWESERSASAVATTTERRRLRACHLQAGYAAGWCREATGLPIDARELACRAEGVSRCRFLLSHSGELEARLADPRFHQPPDRFRTTRVRLS
jgi:hypothetical protein